MKQKAGNLLGDSWFVRTAVPVMLLASSLGCQAVLASPNGPGSLDLKMTLVTNTRFSAGEPVVVHYIIRNTAATGQITFHSGQKNNEWYGFSLMDSKGRDITATPPHSAEDTQGLHQSPEASIPHGDRMEGDLVVTRYLIVSSPGTYTLVVHATTPYYLERDNVGWYPEGRPSDTPLIDSTQDFRFPLTVTAADPAVLRITADSLRRKLNDTGYVRQWKSLAEQLFSLPENEAFSAWRTLLTDPATNDLVLTTAADQLTSQPDATKAELLAEALWDSAEPMDNAAHPGAWKALLKMYRRADPVLKQRIHSLYSTHGISDASILEALTLSNPN